MKLLRRLRRTGPPPARARHPNRVPWPLLSCGGDGQLLAPLAIPGPGCGCADPLVFGHRCAEPPVQPLPGMHLPQDDDALS